jgi:transposase
MIDPAYYTVAHGDGQATASCEASVDVGSDAGSATQCGASVLSTIEPGPRGGTVRCVCRGRLRHLLRAGDGGPSLAPGRYFRVLLLGYFEGLDSERAIAWRAADSLSIRSFLGLELHEAPPDHSTISRTRRLIDVETHRAVFTWVLQRLADAGLVKGHTIGIDATTLEANAALRSIVRRDTGETYQEFLTQLAQASGIATPTRDDLARLDRHRKKKGSNDDWTHPHDRDAKITKMKDGRTHLAHTAEHAVDLETGAVVAVTVQDADAGDTTTSVETLIEAAEQIETVVPDREGPAEVVADKGYHSNQVLVDLEAIGVRSYISEPDRGRRNWEKHPEARDAVYRNRRRIRGVRGKRLLRQRGERLERPFAHLYRTGRMRRVHLRGHDNILKRVLLQAGALNLGLLMRQLVGIGTPRSLQGRAASLLECLWSSFDVLSTCGIRFAPSGTWSLLLVTYTHASTNAEPNIGVRLLLPRAASLA